MKDKLETYVDAHRAAFDDQKADRIKLWHSIKTELDEDFEKPKKRKTLWKQPIVRIAASISLVFGLVYLFGTYTNIQRFENNLVAEELVEIDTYYNQLVNSQIKLIKSNSKLSDIEQIDFLTLIDDLDHEYNILKLELKEGVDNQKIITAIIQNYRKKIQLMEDLLQRIYLPKTNSNENEFIL